MSGSGEVYGLGLEQDSRENPGICIRREHFQSYLDKLAAKGRSLETIQTYAAKLEALYEFLPAQKQITRKVLADWRSELMQHYSPSTVNTYFSVVNGLLEHMGRRDLQLPERLEAEPELSPELTRAEYLRLLRAAKVLGRERTYLMIKIFALVGPRVGELPQITAETVQAGRLLLTEQGERQYVSIPAGLRGELLNYIQRTGISSGPVFVTRNGRPLRRTQVTAEIRALCQDARVDEEKGNPRSLRKLHKTTLDNTERSVRRLVEQSYERMLETEQLSAGWEAEPVRKAAR